MNLLANSHFGLGIVMEAGSSECIVRIIWWRDAYRSAEWSAWWVADDSKAEYRRQSVTEGFAFIRVNSSSSSLAICKLYWIRICQYGWQSWKQSNEGLHIEVIGVPSQRAKDSGIDFGHSSDSWGRLSPRNISLQKKRHSFWVCGQNWAFAIAYQFFWCSYFRVRNACAYTIHQFFQEQRLWSSHDYH